MRAARLRGSKSAILRHQGPRTIPRRARPPSEDGAESLSTEQDHVCCRLGFPASPKSASSRPGSVSVGWLANKRLTFSVSLASRRMAGTDCSRRSRVRAGIDPSKSLRRKALNSLLSTEYGCRVPDGTQSSGRLSADSSHRLCRTDPARCRRAISVSSLPRGSRWIGATAAYAVHPFDKGHGFRGAHTDDRILPGPVLDGAIRARRRPSCRNFRYRATVTGEVQMRPPPRVRTCSCTSWASRTPAMSWRRSASVPGCAMSSSSRRRRSASRCRSLAAQSMASVIALTLDDVRHASTIGPTSPPA